VAKAKKRKHRAPAFRSTPVGRERGHKKLRALKCFDEVHRRIIEGWGMPALADYVQDECDEYTEVSKQGLISVLRRYRDTIPPGQLIQKRIPSKMEQASAQIDEGMDELDELWNLYQIQMERLGIELQNERTIKKLFPSMTQEIRTTREILSTIAELKMDLGLNSRQLGTVDVDAHITAHVSDKFSNPKVARVLANPQKRQKLLGIARQIAKRVDPQVIDAEAEVVSKDEPESSPPESGPGSEAELQETGT